MKFSYLFFVSLIATTTSESGFISVALISNGQDAEPNQFPYQVYLRIMKNDGDNTACGGTLISDQWILTAAHCADDAYSFFICVGSIYKDCRDGYQNVTLSCDYFVHEEFRSPFRYSNDIALIYLGSPINITGSIQPAKLPAYSSTPSTYVGETAVTSGWGRLQIDDFNTPFILQYVSVPIISNEECVETASEDCRQNVLDTNICVSTDNTFMSPCKGDSGGPLVVDNDTLVGITSFGPIEGCDLGYPIAFTRVTSYLDWIKDISGVSTES